MFTLRFKTPSSGFQWHYDLLDRAEIERRGAIALRYDAYDIEVINPYGTDVTDSFAVFR